MTPPTDRGRRLPVWIAGLAVGVAGGLLFWLLPALAILILALFVLPVLLKRGPLLGLAGALIGFGGMWLLVLVRATVACGRFNAAPNQECIQPDLTPWLVAAVVAMATGIVMTVTALRPRDPGGDG